MAKNSVEVVRSLRFGLNKGFKVTKHIAKKPRPASRKKKTSERVRFIRQLVDSVAGLSAYEKKILEYYKTGVQKVEKRAFKSLRKRMGTRSRAMKKQTKLMNVLSNMRKKAE